MPRSPGSAVGLPGYSWDTKLHNYVDNDTGRMIKRSDIGDLLREVTKGSEERLAGYAGLVNNGALSPADFFRVMQEDIKLQTNVNAALAKGGWAQMTPADWGANGAQLRQEYANLRNFANEIAAGNLSPAQIEARAALYTNTTYSRYWEIMTEQEKLAGMTQERLVTVGDEKVCEECQGEASRGWVEIGTYNPPIHAGCRCDVEYSK
jgi:hypothetical protein